MKLPLMPRTSAPLFRVWIARYRDWRPRRWDEVPPWLEVVEPAVEQCLSAEQAAEFLESFNRTMLMSSQRRWAVAVPVVVRLEGDWRPGQTWSDRAVPSVPCVRRSRTA